MVLEINYLRRTVDLTINDFDDELQELEEAAIKILKISGIHSSRIVKEDNLIAQTIRAYVKANFRNTPKEIAEKYQYVFEQNKNFMRSTAEYTTEKVKEDG